MPLRSCAAGKGKTECVFLCREQEVMRNEPGGGQDKMGKEMEGE